MNEEEERVRRRGEDEEEKKERGGGGGGGKERVGGGVEGELRVEIGGTGRRGTRGGERGGGVPEKSVAAGG